jgi:hypothetical protein
LEGSADRKGSDSGGIPSFRRLAGQNLGNVKKIPVEFLTLNSDQILSSTNVWKVQKVQNLNSGP